MITGMNIFSKSRALHFFCLQAAAQYANDHTEGDYIFAS